MKGSKVRRCPGCGRAVIMDDVAHEMRHQEPLCNTFRAVMKAAGMGYRHEPWAVVVAPDGTVKKPGDA